MIPAKTPAAGFVAAGLAAVALLLSCSKDKPSGPASDEIRISPTTNVIEDEVVDHLLDITGDSLTWTPAFYKGAAAVAALRPDDVMVYPGGWGLLRKVLSVSETADRIFVVTESAALTDAIEQRSVDIKQTLTPDDLDSSLGLFGAEALKRLARPSGEFYVPLDGTVLYDAGNTELTDYDQIRLDGEITFRPQFEFHTRIDRFRLHSLVFRCSGFDRQSSGEAVPEVISDQSFLASV
jgi:hypothetical protein